jgi:hypothetical protein
MNSIFKSSIGFVVLFSGALFCSTVYRSYIYSNHLYDFHLADTFPSLFSIPVAYSFWNLLSLIFNKPITKKYKCLIQTTIGFIVYEFLQLFSGGFDVFDLVATLIGTTIVYIYLRYFE